MKVFIDVTESCTSAQNTGTQRITRRIFAELNRCAAVEVWPICWNSLGNTYVDPGESELHFLTRPFEVYSRPTAHPEWRGRNPVREFGRLVSRRRIDVEKEIGRGDVFFAPEFYRDGRCKFLSNFVSQTPARTVGIFHDAADLRLTSVYGDRSRKSRPYLESLAIFDLVICVSEEARGDLHHFWEKYGCSPAQTCVEPWPGELENASELGGDTIDNRILYVSSFQRRKNHLRLLRAAEKLWRRGLAFDLHLIGKNAGLPLNKIVREIWKLRLRRRPLRWLRHVDNETLLHEYRACRFTVYPSLMEGYGLPIVESLLHGKPCICGGNGALGEVARGGGCLIVDQTSEDALAAGIQKLLADQETCARLAADAQARKFRSWSDYIDQLLGHLTPVQPATPVSAVLEA